LVYSTDIKQIPYISKVEIVHFSLNLLHFHACVAIIRFYERLFLSILIDHISTSKKHTLEEG
jgi:hypothetical protein